MSNRPDETMTQAGQLSALELLERGLAGLTGKEQFDALAGTGQLWWQFCQRAACSPPDPAGWHAARDRVAALAWSYDPAPDDGRAFTAAATALADIAQAMAAAGDDSPYLASAVGFWHGTGVLTRRPAETALPADSGWAMTSLVERLLGDPAARLHSKVRVPVLFDRPHDSGGLAGWLEIGELPAGPAGLYPDPRVMSFTRAEDGSFAEGLSRAWEYARAHGRVKGRCVLWRLSFESRDGPVFSIVGGSLGAAFAIALREVLAFPAARRPSWTWLHAKFRGPRPGCAVTGVLGPDGRLSAVGALERKLAAAQAKGWRVVAPAASRIDPARVPSGVRVYWADTIAQARRLARRWRPVRIGLALGVVIALLVGGTVTTALVAHSNGIALQQRDIAVSGNLITQSKALGTTNPTLARQESIAAWLLNPSQQAWYAMLSAATLPGIAVLPSSGPVHSVAISPDGKTLAAGTWSASGVDAGMVQLWDLATRKQTAILAASGLVNSVAFSPDGTTLAAGTPGAVGEGGTVQLWDLAARKQTAILTASGYVSSVAFSPDGTTLAAGIQDAFGDTEVQVWDLATRKQIAILTASGIVESVAFSPDGKTLAVSTGTYPSDGQNTGTVQLWDLATRKQTATLTASGAVQSLAFSPDGKTLAAGTNTAATGAVELWGLAAPGKQPATLTASGPVYSVAFSPDSETLAVGSRNAGDNAGTVQLWDLTAPGEQPATFTASGLVESVAFSPDGKTLAAGTQDAFGDVGTVQLWNAAAVNDNPLGKPFTTTGPVRSTVLSPDGMTIAVGIDTATAGTVQIWDLATRKQTATFMAIGTVQSLAFSPDGRTFAAGTWDSNSGDTEVQIWDLATRKQTIALTNSGIVYSVAFSPDGKTLATGGDNGVQVWDLATGKRTATLPVTGTVSSVAFSPDGNTLAADSNGTVKVWNLGTPKTTALTVTVTGLVESVAFSPDGRTLAIGTENGGGDAGTVQLWEVATRKQTAVIAANDPVISLAFSPDGKTLAFDTQNVSDDVGAVQLWDIATQQQIGNPTTSSGVVSMAFTYDGKTLTAGSLSFGESATAQQWDVAYLTDPVSYLCAEADGTLSRAEWALDTQGLPYQDVCP
jgi:WD40 repeat protein